MNWRNYFTTLSRIFVLQDASKSVTNMGRQINQQFSFDITGNVLAQTSTAAGNVAISPILLQTMLTLLYWSYANNIEEASNLKTNLYLQEFKNSEHALNNVAALYNVARSYAGNLNNTTLRYDNGFFANYDFEFASEFKEKLEYFDYRMGVLTKLQLQELTGINEAEQRDKSLAIGLSTLNYKLKWKYAFDPKLTKISVFFDAAATPKPAEFMYIQNKFLYHNSRDLYCQIVGIPLESADMNFNMYIFYPYDFAMDMAGLSKQLKDINFRVLENEMQTRKLVLGLPKFQLDYFLSLRDLKRQAGKATLSESLDELLKNSKDSMGNLNATGFNIFQQTTMQVDESGELTSDGGKGFFSYVGDYFRQPMEIEINRPFYFVIKNSDVVLLTGYVIEPEELLS